MKLFFIVLCSLFIFCSCNSTIDVFEKTVPFAQHSWNSKDSATFNFEIKDTTAAYNLFIVLRHEDAYAFKNIWLNIQVKDVDSSYTIKREFTLADNRHWLGSAMDDIIEHRIGFNEAPIHLKKGNYTFIVQQAMREDPLQHMLNAGIRVEKVKP